ncbi:hypothetical protein E1218_01920 [Kribbella turkmenica]|uniref:Nuclear transport factor 2 family protein n=1 Tax=Kribbella turkmenica TaxID=2530375 RepID=A0A4R4XHA1_9ACTN|nr:nuclear transport factor 2 family protein [Kribbella turkmenica]TDD30338.1 hypothetical protein E1218_01920 [Kribbella turkmenica]
MTHDRHTIDRHSNAMDLAEAEAVEAVVRDYIDAWRSSDAQRMDRSLHDDLVKRTTSHAAVPGDLSRVTKTQMVQLTRVGGGRSPNAAVEVIVHHVEGDIASAQVATEEYPDYVHLSKTSGAWRIVHDLYRQRT